MLTPVTIDLVADIYEALQICKRYWPNDAHPRNRYIKYNPYDRVTTALEEQLERYPITWRWEGHIYQVNLYVKDGRVHKRMTKDGKTLYMQTLKKVYDAMEHKLFQDMFNDMKGGDTNGD